MPIRFVPEICSALGTTFRLVELLEIPERQKLVHIVPVFHEDVFSLKYPEEGREELILADINLENFRDVPIRRLNDLRLILYVAGGVEIGTEINLPGTG